MCLLEVYTTVSVMVCTQLVVSGDVCMIQLSGWWWCLCLLEVYTTIRVVMCVFIEVYTTIRVVMCVY